jgi:acetyltransferase
MTRFKQYYPDFSLRFSTRYLHRCKLADGTAVTIRPIRWDDEPLIVDFHKSLSAQTVKLRYFGLLGVEARIGHEHLVRTYSSVYDPEFALVVERGRPRRQIVGVARLIKVHGTNDAEVAIVISDDWQGEGLGTMLLHDLLEIGRSEGIERLFGYVLPENHAMQHICRKLGCAMRYSATEDALEVEIEPRSHQKPVVYDRFRPSGR